MNERDSSGGAMTGATGDLTPDEIQRDFVTGERREVSDPERQAEVTQAQAGRAPAESGGLDDPGGDLVVDVLPDATTGSPQPRGRGAGGDDVSDHGERF